MDVEALGPVEFLVVRFPGSRFTGEITPALIELVEAGLIRIVDLVFVSRDEDGTVAAFELSELDDDEAVTAFGGLYDEDDTDLLSDEDLEIAAEGLAPGDSAAVLVWEDVWAARFAAAVRDAGGEVLALERIPREVVLAAAGIEMVEEGAR
jgi:uncharacterized membrane protein